MTGHVTEPTAALADELPRWVTLLRAPNPGPMTLDGTNTWLLRAPSARETVVIDPGPPDPSHLDAIMARGPIALILVTHGHPDHVGAAEELAARSGAPLRGLVAGYEQPDDLRTGAPFAIAGVTITTLRTPGHTEDSVCYLVEGDGQRAIFTGDTILGRGTTVIAHPDGDLAAYLESLTALSAYDKVPALPGHGPALADCAAAARFYLAHRRARLDQVRQAVRAGARTAAEVVATIYQDVDRSLWPAAELSVRAQLAYLAREDREFDRGAVELDSL
ncbi:MAG TPA: MBL fold metallo-hydrolase [Micromonospora sp.]|jgi:glyoxylase-like metal-dependent hydrolase (beta-lactamase superfamily II)|nr:MAG: MBL fold metallo-hydrolase [Actinomycetota bacterium]